MLGVAWTVPALAQGSGETAYTVVRGDTLIALSIRFHTTVSAIATRNNIQNINLIYVGQQ
ncbi:MAG: LysM peptidoglycan-binding domain-containing protein [Anaerolineae bacterium]|nr:LysM peptidoglycan-binding domain-containing protein [Anaerolineae bacterium]